MNHYEQVRCLYADLFGADALGAARGKLWELMQSAPITAFDQAEVPFRMVRLHSIDKDWRGREVRAIVSINRLDDIEEEHVSVSVAGGRLPTWYDLLLVRALAWPDEVEVVQVLPALEGGTDEEYVNLHEVLHLRRMR